VAFCEASSSGLVYHCGKDEELTGLAANAW